MGAGAGVRGVASVELWEEKPTRYPAREKGDINIDCRPFHGPDAPDFKLQPASQAVSQTFQKGS